MPATTKSAAMAIEAGLRVRAKARSSAKTGTGSTKTVRRKLRRNGVKEV